MYDKNLILGSIGKGNGILNQLQNSVGFVIGFAVLHSLPSGSDAGKSALSNAALSKLV